MSAERILTAGEKRELAGTLFNRRELIEMDFSGANLRGARFDRSTLIECNLRGADLRDAHFVLCDLRGVNFVDAILGGDNQFDGTTFRDVVGLTPELRARIQEKGGTFEPLCASPR